MAEVQALPADGLKREQFLQLVQRFEGQRIYIPRVDSRTERLTYVRQLAQQGQPRATVVEALRTRFGLSRSQAYEVASQALAAIQPEAAGAADITPKE